MAISKYERETNINFNDDELNSTVYTCNKLLIRKLDKYCQVYPNDFKLIIKDEFGSTYKVSKKLITIRKPTKKRNLTEEQKQKLRDNLKKRQ